MSDYIEPLKTALLVYPFVALLCSGPFIWVQYHRYGSFSISKATALYIFLFYLVCAYCLVILPLPDPTAVAAMHGGTAEVAGDGQACVELFESHEPGHYDLILMDIRMPRMDGHEAARRIRSMDRSDAATIPIIAMSADAFSDDVEASLSCGMNHHLSKPVSFEMLEKTAAIYLD